MASGDYGDNLAWDAAENLVWVHGAASARVYAEISGPCCYQGHMDTCSLGHNPVAVLVSEGYATAGARVIWVARAVNWDHGIIWTRAAAEDHVLVRGPAAFRVCVDVFDS